MRYDYFRPNYFVVSDAQFQNTPISTDDFIQRCLEIEEWLPARGNNVAFVEKIFELFRDCNLITRANVNFLSSKTLCDEFFETTMNPLGGVLRHKSLPMSKPGDPLRYYSTKNKGRAVILENETYYISSQWYADDTGNPNKEEFYKWVVSNVLVNFSEVRVDKVRAFMGDFERRKSARRKSEWLESEWRKFERRRFGQHKFGMYEFEQRISFEQILDRTVQEFTW